MNQEQQYLFDLTGYLVLGGIQFPALSYDL